MSKSKNFIIWCDKLMAFSFYALIYFLPISIALSESFTGLAILAYLLKRGAFYCGYLRDPQNDISKFRKFITAFKPADSILNVPIYIFVTVSLISMIQSQYFLQSFEGFIGKVLESAFLYFTFIECMRSKKRVKIFLSVLLISCALISMNGIYQFNMGKEFFFGHVFNGRISSSFRQANDFGAYLVMMIPILFFMSFLGGSNKRSQENSNNGLAYFSSFSTRILCFLLFVVAMACLGLTFSRGAWAGFVFSLFLIGVKNRKVLLLYGLTITIFLVVFYPKLGENRVRIHDKKSFREQNNRLNYWIRAADIVKDYPYFGSGINTYALVSGGYSEGWGGYPHNSYLQMTAETGFIGIAAFLWMLFVLFRVSLMALRKILVQSYKMLLVGMLTGLLGFLIHSFFDTNFYSVQLGSLMWVMMGFIVVVRDIGQAPDIP